MAVTRRFGRPRRTTPARRVPLTFDQEDYDTLRALADERGRPPATVAAQLVRDALHRIGRGEEADELGQVRQEAEDLRRELARLREEMTKPPGPRWEWSLDAILTDRAWWDRWIPRLHEVLGRKLETHPLRDRPQAIVDNRGYADIVTALLPPIERKSDGAKRVWYQGEEYRQWAALDWQNQDDTQRRGTTRPDRAEYYEPVIRHLVEALCLLERTGTEDDPYLRLRAEEEIRTSWLRSLLILIGRSEPELLREIIPTTY